jgi:hypothetical protein
MHLLKPVQIQIAKRIAIHRHHIWLANEAGGVAQSARRAKRALLKRVEQIERAVLIAEYRGDAFTQMSDAKHGSLEAEAQELIEQESDEWSACDLSQGFWSVADDFAESAAQSAGQDERFASYDFTLCLQSNFKFARRGNLAIVTVTINNGV